MQAENKGESTRSRHAEVLVISMSFLGWLGSGLEDGAAGDRQLLGGRGPGTHGVLVAGKVTEG